MPSSCSGAANEPAGQGGIGATQGGGGMIWANGWLWIIAALLLAALELAMPGWFFLGMAVAVLVMGAALLLGLWGGGLPMALVVTAVLTGVIWVVLRRFFGTGADEVKIWTRDINDNDR